MMNIINNYHIIKYYMEHSQMLLYKYPEIFELVENQAILEQAFTNPHDSIYDIIEYIEQNPDNMNNWFWISKHPSNMAIRYLTKNFHILIFEYFLLNLP
jgi:hypothetical protein